MRETKEDIKRQTQEKSAVNTPKSPKGGVTKKKVGRKAKGPPKKSPVKKPVEPSSAEAYQSDLLSKMEADYQTLRKELCLLGRKFEVAQQALISEREHSADLEHEVNLMRRGADEMRVTLASVFNEKRALQRDLQTLKLQYQTAIEMNANVARVSNENTKLERDFQDLKMNNEIHMVALAAASMLMPTFATTLKFKRLVQVARLRFVNHGRHSCELTEITQGGPLDGLEAEVEAEIQSAVSAAMRAYKKLLAGVNEQPTLS